MLTSKQWWEYVKSEEVLIIGWLIKQYRGEVTAGNRIREMVEHFEPMELCRGILLDIATQEDRHAIWIGDLLRTRGLDPHSIDISMAEERYWSVVSPNQPTFEEACAIGAHAETMRLERINVIVDDPETPVDIALTFRGILREENFHAKAFAFMAGPEAIQSTKATANLGREVLGLVA